MIQMTNEPELNDEEKSIIEMGVDLPVTEDEKLKLISVRVFEGDLKWIRDQGEEPSDFIRSALRAARIRDEKILELTGENKD